MSGLHGNLRENHTIGAQTRERVISAKLCPPLARHGILLTGLSEARPPFAFSRPQFRYGQILVCLGGEGQVLVDGVQEPCLPGMAYLTPPVVPHAYRAVRGDAAWSIAWVIYATNPDRTGVDIDRPRLVAANPDQLATAIGGLFEETMSSAADPTVLEDWSHLIHAHAQRIVRPSGVDARLRRLWIAVAADLAYPWSIAALAKRAGLSDEQLRRLCWQQLRRSPMRHVTYLRMRHAASLLASASYTVEAVSEQVGYENPFAFSTAFKRAMGSSPSLYRSKQQG